MEAKRKYFDESVGSGDFNYTKVTEHFDSETGKGFCKVENLFKSDSTIKIGRRELSMSLKDYEEIIMENDDAGEIPLLNYEFLKAEIISELKLSRYDWLIN